MRIRRTCSACRVRKIRNWRKRVVALWAFTLISTIDKTRPISRMMKVTIEKSLFKLRQRGSQCTGEGYGVESLNCYRKSLKDELRFARFICRFRQEPTNVRGEGDACFVNGS